MFFRRGKRPDSIPWKPCAMNRRKARRSVVNNKPGALQAITDKIADEGIDLTLLYGSVETKAKTSLIVLVSEDNNAVLNLLNLS